MTTFDSQYPDRVPYRRIAVGESAVSTTNPMPVDLAAHEYIGTLGELNAELDIACDGHAGTMVFQVSGTWSGKIVVEGAVDGVYANLSIVQPGGAISFTGVNNDNQNGVYRALIIAGYTHLRLRMSSYTSGSATVTANTAQLIPTSYVWQLNQANLLATTYQGGTWSNQIVTGSTVATVEARKQTPTGNALNVQIGPGDVISNVPVVMEYGHHQIHEGESYSYCNLQTGGLNSGSSFDIRISVPALAATTRTPHMVFEVIANGECEAYLHSGVTWTAGGVQVEASANTTGKDNRNHNSINAAGTLLYVAGGTALTVNSTGTLKYIWFLPAAVRSSAGDRSINEIDLAASTEYMFRVTSRATGLKFLIRLDWYEDLGV